MNLLQEIEQSQKKPAKAISKFSVGDTVRVHFHIVEGDKERIQVFEGVVIGRKGKDGPQARFTVRRVAYNEGVERVFPLHSPRVEKVEVVREGHVRRAKLHYLRELAGKAARVKAKGRSASKKAAEMALAINGDPEAVEETPDEVEPKVAVPEEAATEEDAPDTEVQDSTDSEAASEESGTKEESS